MQLTQLGRVDVPCLIWMENHLTCQGLQMFQLGLIILHSYNVFAKTV